MADGYSLTLKFDGADWEHLLGVARMLARWNERDLIPVEEVVFRDAFQALKACDPTLFRVLAGVLDRARQAAGVSWR